MGKIIAIGGGEIGRPGTKIETELIDKEIIRLSGKAHPKLLFVPTASKDSEGYIEVVRKYFGERLRCRVDELKLVGGCDEVEMRRKVLESDIIYVGGGNTYFMLKTWRRCGFDNLLRWAYDQGKILSGVSAGAVCWFEKGLSDYKRFLDPSDASFNALKGLGFIKGNIILSPHQIAEDQRLFELMKYVAQKGGLGLALDDMCAIEIVDQKFRLITSSKRSSAYKVFKSRGLLRCQRMLVADDYLEMSELLRR